MDELLCNDASYMETLERVKREISGSRARALLAVNSEVVCMYWRIGKLIDEHSEWGNRFVESLSSDIRVAYPGIKGFSVRSLKYMLRLAREYDFEFVQQLAAQIPWGHTMYLLDKVGDRDRRDWYMRKAAEHGWSRSVLMHQVSIRLFERQAEAQKVTNFDRMLPPADSEMVQQALKDPYIFDFITADEGVEERTLEDEMVRNITGLLLELGTGFAFMGRQYHLIVSDKDFYIDLLFYNTRLSRYFVIELKAGEFRPEYTGKLGFYVAAVDDLLRNEHDGPTVGLLLCKTKDNTIAEYSLRSTSAPIGVSEYRTADELPEEMRGILPTPEDIASRI
mgnify:FL=1